jgi:tripeptidyl-peptidase-1
MKTVLTLTLLLSICGVYGYLLSEAPDLQKAGYNVVGPVDDSVTMKIAVALTRSNDDKLSSIVSQVSDPKHPRYGKYLTTDEAQHLTRPSTESSLAVQSWLLEHEVEFKVSGKGHTITLEPTVEQSAKMFGAKFVEVFNPQIKKTAVVGDKIVIPDKLKAHVESVFGVHELPLPPRKLPTVSASPAAVTPQVIAEFYGVKNFTVVGDTKNRIGVVEFQGQLMSQKDLTTFFQKYVPGFKTGDDQVYKYVSDKNQGEGVEANLDVQYAMGVAPGVKTEMWQYAGYSFCTDLKTWTTGILGTTNPPTVFTVSYGWQGELSQLGCTTSQVSSIDADFKTIASTGVTILFASGDSGSGYTSSFSSGAKLYASWPASSLYVTAVGATRFQGQTVGNPEQATDQFGSGGGFSRIITQPSWQNAAVTSFYAEETKLPPSTMYGKGGRATPDVAALGEGFQVIMNGNPEAVGGTSASTPLFAGIVALLNQARQAAGKPSMGYLNPWIYQNSALFTDITVGNDRISRSGTSVPDGFDCVKGWDPVTGFGTPKFKELLTAALNH